MAILQRGRGIEAGTTENKSSEWSGQHLNWRKKKRVDDTLGSKQKQMSFYMYAIDQNFRLLMHLK